MKLPNIDWDKVMRHPTSIYHAYRPTRLCVIDMVERFASCSDAFVNFDVRYYAHYAHKVVLAPSDVTESLKVLGYTCRMVKDPGAPNEDMDFIDPDGLTGKKIRVWSNVWYRKDEADRAWRRQGISHISQLPKYRFDEVVMAGREYEKEAQKLRREKVAKMVEREAKWGNSAPTAVNP